MSCAVKYHNNLYSEADGLIISSIHNEVKSKLLATKLFWSNGKRLFLSKNKPNDALQALNIINTEYLDKVASISGDRSILINVSKHFNEQQSLQRDAQIREYKEKYLVEGVTLGRDGEVLFQQSASLEKPIKELENTLKIFLESIGVSYNALDEIRDSQGNLLDVVAKANIVNNAIEIVEGRADVSTLAEETAHFFVEMLGEDHPNLRWMMNNITSYDIYKDVVREYSDIYNNDTTKLKKEAVGKVIAQKIVGTFKENNSKVDSWFKALWNKIKSIFKRQDLRPELDAFEQSANQILSNITKGLKKTTSTEEFYQANKVKSADDVLSKLDEFANTIQSPAYTNENDNRYLRFINGIPTEIKNKVADYQTKVFEKKVGKEAAKNINDNPNNKVKREVGIKLHDVARNLVDLFTSNKGNIKDINKSILTSSQFNTLSSGIRDIVDQINKIQEKIDPNKKAVFKTEQIIFSEKEDMAGSMDLLVVFSDGSVGIFDWKFINFKTSDGKVIETELSESKEESYNLQISEYKNILQREVGVNKIRISRVVPINVQYKSKKVNGTYINIPELSNLEIGGKDYLQQVPLADELTNDKRLNSLLETLLGIKKELKSKLKIKKNDTRLKSQLYNISKSIKEIQLNHNVNAVLDTAGLLFNDITKRLEINDELSNDYLTEGDLREYLNTIKIYKNIASDAENVLKETTDPEEKAKLQLRLDTSSGALNRLEYSIYEKIKERIAEKAMDMNIKNPLELQKETSVIGNLFRNLANWDHPLFKLFNKFLRKSIDDTRKEVNKVAEELETLNKALFDFYGSKNIKVFDYLINNKTGNLYSEYKTELYTERVTASENKNIKWIKENFIQTEEDKKRFQANREEYFGKLDKFYKNRTETEISKMKEQWLNRFDVSKESAWLNKNNYYISVKDKDKWQSNEFKFIQNNKALKDYYEYYIFKNREFSSFLPVDIKKNFVPNIHKDYIDKVLTNGMSSITGLGESLLNSLETKEQDEFLGMIDAKTGEPIPSIPILYTNQLTNTDGKVDNSLKSRDLSKIMLLYAKMAYNHKHMSGIEDNVLLIREQLSNQKQIVTDKLGRPIRKEIGDGFETAIGSKQTLDAFDTFMRYYLYGQSIQNKDVSFKYKDRQISGTKALKGAMTYLSAKALAFNPISIGANFFGGMTNTYLTGMKGTSYNRKQLTAAHNNFITNHAKFKAFSGYFEVGQEDLTVLKAKELSASKTSKILSTDTMFIGQRKTDQFVDETVTNAMGQNYGLDSNSKITKLNKLPEGTKSLWDLAEIKNGELVIEGLTDEALNNFRRKVRIITGSIKGTTSKEDISIIQTNILGQTVMQFRNWMPGMIKERFGKLRLNEDLEEYEMGRFRVGFNEIAHKGFFPALAKFTAEIVSFSTYRYQPNSFIASQEYANYLTNNPSSELTIEEYMQVKEAQLRALAAEVRMYLITLGVILAMAGDWDDDDKPDYKKYWATRKLVKLMHRSALELGFFFSPSSATELVRTPIPLTGLAIDLQKLVTNTFDESLDLAFGRSDSRDKTGKLYYTAKMIPIVKTGTDLFEVFDSNTK